MKTFLKIAWRNIVRNKYRSLLTIMAISLGLAGLVFLQSFAEGVHYQMIANYTDLISGHFQIHRQGFQKKMGLERSIVDVASIETLLKQDPEILSFSRRIKDFVLVSSAEQSSGVLLVGIDPAQEKQITTLPKRIKKGEFLKEGQDDQIILGKVLLEVLNVDLGDKVVLMGQGADGSLVSGAYRVCGVLDTGTDEMDKGIALISLPAAQQLLVMDNKVSEFAVRLSDVAQVDKIAAKIRKQLDPKTYETLTWGQIQPIIMQWVGFDNAIINIILMVVIVIVAAGILNTVLMGVLERIREFGIMLALGTKRNQVVTIVGLESVMLGIIGMVAGLFFGILLTKYFGKYGVNLTQFGNAFESDYIGSIIYTRLKLANLIFSSAVVLFTSIVVSIYPAWKAASLRPVKAIRHF